MAVDPKFFITRGDKQFVLYAGLLNEAHERGLKSIETHLIQIPSTDNDNFAVMYAVVEMEDGRTFSGIGDASPASVGKMIVPHLLRMAETRSKARALRDAVNIAVTAFEELGPDDETAPAPVTPLREAQQQASQAAKPQYQPQGEGPKPASRKQLNYLKSLVEDAVDGGLAAFEEKVGKPLSELTSKEATKLIERFKGKTG